MRPHSLGIGPDSTFNLEHDLEDDDINSGEDRRMLLLENTSCVKHLTYRILADNTYEPDHGVIRDHEAPTLALDIIASAEKLETLSLVLDYSFAHPDPQNFSRKLVLANNLSYLQILKLRDIRLTRRTLFECLTRCSHTLKRLKMEIIVVRDIDEVWDDALRLIASMPYIEILDLSRLCETEAEDVVFRIQSMHGGLDTGYTDGMLYGRGMVKGGIERNLEAGLMREEGDSEYD